MLGEDAEGGLYGLGRKGRGGGGQRRFALVIFRFDVIVEQLLKRCGEFVVIPFQRGEMLAVDVNRDTAVLRRCRAN